MVPLSPLPAIKVLYEIKVTICFMNFEIRNSYIKLVMSALKNISLTEQKLKVPQINIPSEKREIREG